MHKPSQTCAKTSSTKILLLIASATVLVALAFFFTKATRESTSVTAVSNSAFSQTTTLTNTPASLSLVKMNAVIATSPEAGKAVQTLQEILKSRNDNDQRLDTELKHLIPSTREAFREKYRTLRLEDRNGRGTIVFLLGRNLETPEDMAFMGEVLSEKPCLSLEDCSKAIPSGAGADLHLEAGANVTMSYPQLVGLNALAAYASQVSDSGVKPVLNESALKIIRDAESSGNPMVERKAREIAAKLKI